MSGNLLYEQQEIIVILLKYISPQQDMSQYCTYIAMYVHVWYLIM